MEAATMKPYKYKKGDGIKMVGTITVGIIFTAIALYFDWPSPDEIFYKFIGFIIAIIVIISPIITIVRIARKF